MTVDLYNDKSLAEHDPEALIKSRKHASDYYQKTIAESEASEIVSPCGHYKVLFSSYKTEPGYSDCSHIRIFKHDRLLFDLYGNGFHWHFWINKHPKTGHDYLLFAEDYQGYNVVDLTAEVNRVYLPKAVRHGAGWCTLVITKFDEQSCQITAEGCFWACPYEELVLDVSAPDILPFPILAVRDLDE